MSLPYLSSNFYLAGDRTQFLHYYSDKPSSALSHIFHQHSLSYLKTSILSRSVMRFLLLISPLSRGVLNPTWFRVFVGEKALQGGLWLLCEICWKKMRKLLCQGALIFLSCFQGPLKCLNRSFCLPIGCRMTGRTSRMLDSNAHFKLPSCNLKLIV